MGETRNLFSDTLVNLRENKERRERGEHIAIPFPFLRLSSKLPGIQQGRYIITTASSKTGKTKLTDFMFLYHPIQWVMSHETQISLKIFYFSLEMSKRDKMLEAISHRLFTKRGIIRPPDKLQSMYEDYILTDDILRFIEDEQSYFENFEKIVTFIDNRKTNSSIFAYMQRYAHANGHYIDREGNRLNTSLIEQGNMAETSRIFKYVADRPDEFVLVVTDHVSLLSPTSVDGILMNAMKTYSATHCLHMRDMWNYIPVSVQQQAAAQESVENIKANKLRPSANGLGDCKLTGRDCNLMLGLFAPARHELTTWAGYNIIALNDHYRELSVILNRNGSATRTHLFFNGAVNFFKELPRNDEPERMREVLQHIQDIQPYL